MARQSRDLEIKKTATEKSSVVQPNNTSRQTGWQPRTNMDRRTGEQMNILTVLKHQLASQADRYADRYISIGETGAS